MKLTDKISDGMKHDLGMVFCDMRTCSERGEYARCYLDNFKKCPYYFVRKIKIKNENLLEV